MTPDQVVKHFGSQVAAAQSLGIEQSAIAQWVKEGRVPELRQYQIQVVTAGRLVAVLPTPTSQEVA